MTTMAPTPIGCELLNVLFGEALQRYDIAISEKRDDVQQLLEAAEIDSSAVLTATTDLNDLKRMQRKLWAIREQQLYKADNYRLSAVINDLLYNSLSDAMSLDSFSGETVLAAPVAEAPTVDFIGAVRDIAKAMRTTVKATTPEPVDAVIKTLADELENTYEETFGEPYPGGSDALNNLGTLMTSTHAAIVKRMIGINV